MQYIVNVKPVTQPIDPKVDNSPLRTFGEYSHRVMCGDYVQVEDQFLRVITVCETGTIEMDSITVDGLPTEVHEPLGEIKNGFIVRFVTSEFRPNGVDKVAADEPALIGSLIQIGNEHFKVAYRIFGLRTTAIAVFDQSLNRYGDPLPPMTETNRFGDRN